MSVSSVNILVVRLKPEQDLKQALREFVLNNQIQAGFVLSAIGSLRHAAIRFADRATSEQLNETFEILSLNGTLSIHGIHLHAAIANSQGQVIGGHVDRGCIIYTTAEIVIGEIPDLLFLRTLDEQTGFLELDITKKY